MITPSFTDAHARTRRLIGNDYPLTPTPMPPEAIRLIPYEICPRCRKLPVLPELRSLSEGLCYECWSQQALLTSLSKPLYPEVADRAIEYKPHFDPRPRIIGSAQNSRGTPASASPPDEPQAPAPASQASPDEQKAAKGRGSKRRPAAKSDAFDW